MSTISHVIGKCSGISHLVVLLSWCLQSVSRAQYHQIQTRYACICAQIHADVCLCWPCLAGNRWSYSLGYHRDSLAITLLLFSWHGVKPKQITVWWSYLNRLNRLCICETDYTIFVKQNLVTKDLQYIWSLCTFLWRLLNIFFYFGKC